MEKTLDNSILKLAFGLDESAALTKEQQDIYEETRSGKAVELMKISSEDPLLLVYVGLYNKLEENKESIWKKKVIGKESAKQNY